jgi:hypothetical protein
MTIVKLTPPAQFPAQYAEICLEFLREYWQGRRWEMEQEFGLYDLPHMADEDLVATMIAEKLAQIAHAAAGDYDRGNEDLAGEVYECCQTLAEHLFAVPGLGSSYTIPKTFWDAPLGQMIAVAFIWVEHDQLITIGEAARLAGTSISTISSRVARGALRSYPDPNAPNPQKARRLVRRNDIEVKHETQT